MGLVGIEAVMSAVKAKLQSSMAAKVAALNAAYADAYVLTTIATGSYYSDVPDVTAASFEFPAVILVDDGHRAIEEQCSPERYVCEYAVIVDVVVRGTDSVDLSARLRRYTRAVKEILVARHSLAATSTSCRWDATNGHRLTDPDSGDFLQDMASRFYIVTAEEVA